MKRWSIFGIGAMLLFAIVLTGCDNSSSSSNTNTQTEQTNNTSNQNNEETSSQNNTEETNTSSENTSSNTTSDNTTSESTSNEAADVEIRNPDSIVVVTVADPIDTMDPAYAYDSGSGGIIFNVYETLLFFDGEDTEKFIPMLSTEIPSTENGLVSEDGRIYTFPVRVGTTFHYGPVMDADGNEIPGSGVLSAEDVAYSIHRLLLQDRSGGPSWMLIEPLLGVSSIMEMGRNIEAENGTNPDDINGITDLSSETLVAICENVKQAVSVEGDNAIFYLAEPFSPFLQVMVGYWAAILDQEWAVAEIKDNDGNVVKKADWNGDCGTWQNYYDPRMEASALYPVANGTGPYKLERWRVDEEIYMLRNDDYWRERPANVKEVVWQFSPEMSTRLLMLEAGDADIIAIPISYQDQVEPLIENGMVTRYENLPTGASYFWSFNQNVDPLENDYIGSGQLDGDGIPADFFSDIDVRKGFGYVMDFDIYLNDVINGEGIRMLSPVHSTVFGYNPDQAVYNVDLEKAEEHLRKAWGGELWEKGFKLNVPYVSGGQAVKLTTEIMAANLQQLNPKFELIPQDFQSSKIREDDDLGKVPFAYEGWGEDYHDPHNWVFPVLHSRGFYARNMSLTPELQQQLDDLIIQGRMELDPERRKQIYYEIQQITYDEALIITLEEWTRRRFMRSWLTNYVNNPGYPTYYFWHFEKGADQG